MNNEEKKQFIEEGHRLLMQHDPYNEKLSPEKMLEKENKFMDEYFPRFLKSVPDTLFKFRKGEEYDHINFENDTAWFSHPEDFNDTADSTINNDIENELIDVDKNPSEHLKRLSKALIKATSKKYGAYIPGKSIDSVYGFFKNDGSINEVRAKSYFRGKLPDKVAENLIKKLKENSEDIHYKKVIDAVKGNLNSYMDINSHLRKETLVFSLTEHTTEAMWTHYGNEMKGFCIEYEIPRDTLLGQRMLLNLFPVYYGDKPQIKFFDLMVKGLNSLKQKNGICYDDYRLLFLSAYTKDASYSFENEWRITFDKRFGENLQNFPFIKSVILGERIDDDGKKRLIAAANKKRIPIYQRQFNKTLSKISLVRLNDDRF